MARTSCSIARLRLALLGALLFYLTLPYWGTAWHSLVPEHEHWWIGGGATDTISAPNLCSLCTRTTNETVVHAFNPLSALQFFSLMIGFSVLVLLHIPTGFSIRLLPAVLFLKTPLLVPLDPPPMR